MIIIIVIVIIIIMMYGGDIKIMISNDTTTLLHTYIQSNKIHTNFAYNTWILQLNNIDIIM